jgi:hypothetical protein
VGPGRLAAAREDWRERGMGAGLLNPRRLAPVKVRVGLFQFSEECSALIARRPYPMAVDDGSINSRHSNIQIKGFCV